MFINPNIDYNYASIALREKKNLLASSSHPAFYNSVTSRGAINFIIILTVIKIVTKRYCHFKLKIF